MATDECREYVHGAPDPYYCARCGRHAAVHPLGDIAPAPAPEPPMGALEAALRGLACRCHGDTEGHEVTEHLTPGEREVYEWARVSERPAPEPGA